MNLTMLKDARRWLEPAARFGYIANGLIYVAVGLLALRAASRGGAGAYVDRRQALYHVVAAPFGQFLLAIVALGLLAYALAHLLMAFRSRYKEGRTGVFSIINRLGHLVSSAVHASLALTAAQLLYSELGATAAEPHDWTARAMAYPLGRWVVAAVGLMIVGYGVYSLYKAYTANFRKIFGPAVDEERERGGVRMGRLGYLTRAVIYLISGWFLVRAAWFYDPEEAAGLGEALVILAGQSYGPWLLGATAVGLIAFGLYGIFLGKYRDFNL